MTVLLTIPEVADALRVSRSTAYRLIAAGALPVTRVHRRSARVTQDALDRYIKAATDPAFRRLAQ